MRTGTASGRDRSSGITATSGWPPNKLDSSDKRCARRATRTSLAPRARNARENALPIPLEAPVTRARSSGSAGKTPRPQPTSARSGGALGTTAASGTCGERQLSASPTHCTQLIVQ